METPVEMPSYRVGDLLRHPVQGLGIVRDVDGWMVWIDCAGPDASYLGWNAGERLAEWSLHRRPSTIEIDVSDLPLTPVPDGMDEDGFAERYPYELAPLARLNFRAYAVARDRDDDVARIEDDGVIQRLTIRIPRDIRLNAETFERLEAAANRRYPGEHRWTVESLCPPDDVTLTRRVNAPDREAGDE